MPEFRAVAQRVIENPPGHLANQSGAFGRLERLRFRYLAQFRVRPAQHAAQSGDPARAQIQLWLVEQLERVFLEGAAQSRLVTLCALLAFPVRAIVYDNALRRSARRARRELA